MSELKKTIEEMIESGDYSPRICGILNLIIEDKMNSIELKKYLSQQCITINDIKSETLQVIIDYANICLEDDILTEQEMRNIQLLKLFLRVKEGDFIDYGKEPEITEILTWQLRKMYNDDVIDKEEALMKNDLQSLFDLSYDQFLDIVNEVAQESLDRGADIKNLDTVIVPNKY
ncbi:MAG: hypothetical protein IKI06_04545 [Prevotella sp.]|nr:hypothetical protein [Prevotella sp.]